MPCPLVEFTVLSQAPRLSVQCMGKVRMGFTKASLLASLGGNAVESDVAFARDSQPFSF